LELTGKRALVTGGSRGIGKAIARQLALEGADVVIVSRGGDELAASAAELAAESGRSVTGIVGDTGNDAAVARFVAAAAAELGGIDILVNSAARPGSQIPGYSYDSVTDESFFEEMNIKVRGYLRCAQQVAPLMIAEGWGRIINVSGLGARRTGNMVGAIRNVAVSAMTKTMADDLGPHNINVTVLHPGITRTEATSAEAIARPPDNILGRVIDAEEVAYVACFLASPKAVAITGDAIAAGGGEPGVIHY
jgi:NAD(P)-dependent dehydrogenase (short-subunit alcohol dehydrogenase family)